MIGSEYGRYKVVERLGAGGMGEVYRAEDTTLGRPVALKFLAAHLLHDDEAKQRFLREARAAAAVRHPHICHVYEVGEENGKTFLAMDYLEGESLEDRIAKGPLPLKDTLDIGRQIAEGLEAAHEKGIVHRDIKPANVMIDAKGRATILDFGLARLTEASKLTRADQTVGTAAYMSPEQIQGADVDHRTDIWALGCVLYEMVAGLRPFKGQYDQALLYEICNQEPEPLTAVRAGVPMELEFIVGKCLAKDREDRTGAAIEVARELRTLGERLKSGRSTILMAAVTGSQSAVFSLAPQAAPVDQASGRKLPFASALAAVFAVVAAAFAFLYFNQTPVERPVSNWAFSPAGINGSSTPVLSPDGRHIAFVARDGSGQQKLWVRDLDQLEPRELAGTERAQRPFWSPDSAFIGFRAGELKKVSVQGGPIMALCPVSGLFFGGSWSPDGETIAFSAGDIDHRIFEVAARGGEPRLLFEQSQQRSNLLPQFLPAEGGAQSLLIRVGEFRTAGDIVLKNLETGESVTLAKGDQAVYSSSGHIVYALEGQLWALPFSRRSLKATGDAFPIGRSGSWVSVAGDGTLVTLRGSGDELGRLVWRDRSGKKVGEIGQPQAQMQFPTLSPDGKSALVDAVEGDNVDVWAHEVSRAVTRRLTFDEAFDGRALWSPSGLEITFQSTRDGSLDIFRTAADGTGEAELLIGTDADERPYGWSPDGRYLIYTSESGSLLGSEIRYLKRKEDGQGFDSQSFLQANFASRNPSLSPDGGLLAYCSDRAGQEQVYVRPFPSGAGELQVSTDGGCAPRWSRDGKELYYVSNRTLMAVEVRRTPALEAGAAKELFDDENLRGGPRSKAYDVSADGRFLMVEAVENPEREPLTIEVIENWYEEIGDRPQE